MSTRSAVMIVLTLASTGPALADEQGPPVETADAKLNRLSDELAQMKKDMAATKTDLTSLLKIFEFHGYQRAGAGFNSKGGQQGAFLLPGAFAKYRLGNEAEVYGEYELDANWINPDHDGAWLKTGFMMSLTGNRNGSFDTVTNGNLGIRQAYVQAGHLLTSKPDMSFWAGQRYYRRRDIHLNDFYYLNTSTFGGGFEDLDVGVGKLAVAFLIMSDDAAVFDLGKLTRNMIDIRLYGIPVGEHQLDFWLLPTIGAERPSGVPQTGIAGGVFLITPKFIGGKHEMGVEFGYAGASDLGGNAFNTTNLSTADENGWMLRVLEFAVVQATPSLALMWDGIFQLDNRNGSENGSRGNLWVSVGARPVLKLSKYFGLTVETGLDVVNPEAEGTSTGWLAKVTAAGILRPGSTFFSRPELRLFVTGAFWADEVKCVDGTSTNCVGGGTGNPFAGDTAGATFGLQAESWW